MNVRNKGFNYFDAMADMVQYSVRSAKLLHETFSGFQVSALPVAMAQMHELEHAGDMEKHAMVEHLSREFIAPIEREDIVALAENIDDLTDTIEDVLINMYMYNVRTMREDAVEFSALLMQCCDVVERTIAAFKNFKNSGSIKKDIVEVNRLEEEGDKRYIAAVRALYTSDMDARDVVAWTEVFLALEKSCDACEHIADLIESVIMKNS